MTDARGQQKGTKVEEVEVVEHAEERIVDRP